MADIQVTITDNNATIDVEFAQSLSTNIAIHNTDAGAHASILSEIETINTGLAAKAESADVPTKVSELTNDSNYATVAQIPTVPTLISEFTNDVSYATSSDLTTKANTSLNNITQASALTNLGFAGQSLTTNGYYKLPNGLIIQWGHVTGATITATTQTVTFPIAFPTACLNVFTQIDRASSEGFACGYVQVASIYPTYFTCTYTVNRYWFAIGY